MERDCKRFVLVVQRHNQAGLVIHSQRMEFDDYAVAAEEAGDLWELSSVTEITLLDTVARVQFKVI